MTTCAQLSGIGEIVHICELHGDLPDGYVTIETSLPLHIAVERMVYVDGSFFDRGPRPQNCTWDPLARSWVLDLDGIRTTLLEAVRREVDARIYAPIAYQGAVFDADALSRERIARMMSRLERGDGLPPGWRGWRDVDNRMHWADSNAEDVWSDLRGLSTMIENREQAVLLAAWIHKDTLAGISDGETLMKYDVAAGWPGG